MIHLLISSPLHSVNYVKPIQQTKLDQIQMLLTRATMFIRSGVVAFFGYWVFICFPLVHVICVHCFASDLNQKTVSFSNFFVNGNCKSNYYMDRKKNWWSKFATIILSNIMINLLKNLKMLFLKPQRNSHN